MVCIRNVMKQLLPKFNSSHIYWIVWSVEMDKKLKKVYVAVLSKMMHVPHSSEKR